MPSDTIILYSRTGAATAYTLDDGETLYTYGGRPVGYIFEDAIFNFQGRILGWYLDGWVIDFDGTRVFFTKESKGGPNTPIKGIQPIRGIRQYCPGRDNRLGKGLKPPFSLSWSPRSGEVFFGEAVFAGMRRPKRRPAPPVDAESEAVAEPEKDAATDGQSAGSGEADAGVGE